MRAWFVAVVLVLAACKGKGKAQEGVPPAKAAAVPTVAVATALAKENGKPPFLMYVDPSGKVKVAAAQTWADFDAGKIRFAKKLSDLEVLDRYVRESVGLGQAPYEQVGKWDSYNDTDIDLSALEDKQVGSSADDPPPPPDEDKPDDGADESGGTGTAMALDEGKMGKQDSDRAEGQYKMRKDGDLGAAALAPRRLGGGVQAFASLAAVEPTLTPNEDGTPSRLAQVSGAVMEDGKLDPLNAMLFVAPGSNAAKLIEMVSRTQYAIAVSFNGKIRPLNLQFVWKNVPYDDSPDWMEVRVSSKGLIVEAVPDKPIEASLDKLGDALEQARTTRGVGKAALPVDVLVDADVTAQRLIDVAVALEAAHVQVIGMGAAPSPEELKRRGHRTPTVHLGMPAANGDLDKALIRRVVKENADKIKTCYDKALETEPTLHGTVMVHFFISPKGTVASSTGDGVDPALSMCIANVIAALKFPEPKGGGGVDVNYPFSVAP